MTSQYPPVGPPVGPQGSPQGSKPPRAPARRRISPRLVISAVLVILLIVFLAENTRSVRMRLLFPEVQAPLWLALLIAAALGALAVVIVRWRRGRRAERQPPAAGSQP